MTIPSRASVALAVAFAVALAAAPTRAQTEAAPWTETFGRAVARMADGDLEGAAQLFERAYEQGSRPEALFNEGLAWSRAGRHAAAFDAFDRVVRLHSHELDATALADAVARRAAEAEHLGVIDVRAGSTGGEVRLDGSARGTLEPAGRVELRADAGAHSVELRWGDHDAMRASREIDLTAGAMVEVSFAIDLAIVDVTAPDGAEISIGGLAVGRGHATLALVPGDDLVLTTAGMTRPLDRTSPGRSEIDLRPHGDDGVVIALLVGAGALALIAGGIALGVWAGDSSGPLPPYGSPPYGIVQALQAR